MKEACQTLRATGEVSANGCADHLRGARSKAEKPSLLMFHGWAASSAVWQCVVGELAQAFDVIPIDLPGHGAATAQSFASLDAYIDALLAGDAVSLPKRFAVLGWSLGGLLAAKLAERAPDRVWALIMVATNRQFVASDDWPDAVAAQVFSDFETQLARSGADQAFMRRFWQLQCRGGVQARRDVQWLSSSLAQRRAEPEALTTTLRWLQSASLPDLDRLPMPVLHQFGGHDALVPVRAAQSIRRLASRGKVQRDYRVTVFRQSSHLPFLSEPRAWLAQTREFLGEAGSTDVPQPVDKGAVARAFSKAAVSYDQHAGLQYQLGSGLLQQLPKNAPGRVLDLGAGTGRLGVALAQTYPDAQLVQLDLSASMLDQCRQQAAFGAGVQGDFDCLPFADGSFDLVFSNLALQWCFRLESTLSALCRQLAPGGLLLMTTLTSGSMRELGEAWAGVDEREHINNFYDQQHWRFALEKAGFVVDAWEPETRTEYFAELSKLLTSVRGIGAGNATAGRPLGLTGKRRFARFVANYDAMRNGQGLLPLSYEIVSAVLRRPAESG